MRIETLSPEVLTVLSCPSDDVHPIVPSKRQHDLNGVFPLQNRGGESSPSDLHKLLPVQPQNIAASPTRASRCTPSVDVPSSPTTPVNLGRATSRAISCVGRKLGLVGGTLSCIAPLRARHVPIVLLVACAPPYQRGPADESPCTSHTDTAMQYVTHFDCDGPTLTRAAATSRASDRAAPWHQPRPRRRVGDVQCCDERAGASLPAGRGGVSASRFCGCADSSSRTTPSVWVPPTQNFSMPEVPRHARATHVRADAHGLTMLGGDACVAMLNQLHVLGRRSHGVGAQVCASART